MSIVAESVVVPMGQPCPEGYDPGPPFFYEDGTTGTVCWKRSVGLGALGNVLPLVLLGIVLLAILAGTSRPSSSAEE